MRISFPAAPIAFVTCAFLTWTIPVFAQSSRLNDGANYLRTTQTADGSWGGTPTSINTNFPTTIVALDALRAIELTPSTSQSNAIAYLSAQRLDVTPFIAARVISLAGTGANTTTDVETLIARQNEDGGWGTSEGFESDTLDTSLALLALHAANVSARTTLINGLNYLALRQNPDGGWPLNPGQPSQVFYTSYALQALNSLRLQFGISAFQSGALAFLRSRQNPIDGGSGTAFETALSLLAILGSGQQLTFAETRALSFLGSTQLANGSWASDAYSTGLALSALSIPPDTDADGMSDQYELAHGLNPNDASDAARDNDGDGLPNLEESRRPCLNPNAADTDGDTLNDGDESANGSDPCNAASRNRAPAITSQPITTATVSSTYSYQAQAADADNDSLTFTLLRSPAGMSITATGLIQWVPAMDQLGSFTVVIKVSDERGGAGYQQYRVRVPAQGIDLTIASVDISQITTDVTTLVVTGRVRVQIMNERATTFAGDFETLLFEDRNGDGAYQTGVDLQLGTGAFSGSIAGASTTQLDVPVSGVVQFRDQLVHAFVDSGEVVTETSETNNVGHSGTSSKYQPPVNQFLPKVKWVHHGDSMSRSTSPVVVRLDTNSDRAINEQDMPAVIYRTANGLRALRGDTGVLLWEVRDTPAVTFSFDHNPAVGDLDNDGFPEIVIPSASGGIHCLNHDGTLDWTNSQVNADSSPTIVDLDHNGQAEILVGSVVLNSNGSSRVPMRLPDNIGGSVVAGATQAADLDNDGIPELVSGPSVFDRNGNIKWFWRAQGNGPYTLIGTLDGGATQVSIPNSSSLITDGYTAIADIDDDTDPEVILVCDGSVGNAGIFVDTLWVFEHDGRLKQGFPRNLFQQVPNDVSYRPGPPAIADFDGDGEPEIAISVGRELATTTSTDAPRSSLDVYERDGQLKWRRDALTIDRALGHGPSPPTAFDFDGDGAFEIVYQTAQKVMILNGRNGETLYEIGVGRNGITASVAPAIADVDDDGIAEIVVVGTNSPDGSPQRSGVVVLGDTSGNWRNARRVWNQWLYHVTNVDDDGGIPQLAVNNWLSLNTSRAQSPLDGVETTAAPDLSISKVTINRQGCPGGVDITARVGNGGGLHVAAGQRVNFYAGDPQAGGLLLATRLTTQALKPGQFEDVTLTGVNLQTATPVFVTVNELPVDTLTTSSNLALLPQTWAQTSGYCPNCSIHSNITARLGIDGVNNTNWRDNFGPGISTNPHFYEVHFQFPVNATSVTIQNAGAIDTGFLTGTLNFSNGFSTPFTFNSAGEGTVSFPQQQNISWIRLTGVTAASRGPSLSEFIVAGSYTEPSFRINEGEGRAGNNKAASGIATCDSSVNGPPIITSAPVISAQVGSTYNYQLLVTDPNNDPITFSLVAAPSGMVISTTGLITWTPTAGNAAVTVQVADGRNGVATQSFNISVTASGGNHAPVFTSTPAATVTRGQLLQYDVTATDADNDIVIFTLRQSPAGATLDQLTGTLLWTPSDTQTSTQFFTLVADDGRGGQSQQSFAVAVRANSQIELPQDVDGDGYFGSDDCDDTNPNINPGMGEIPGNGIDDDCNPDTLDSLPQSLLACSLTSDKRSYNSNSIAELAAVVRNTSNNVSATELSGQVTVTDAGGSSVFSSPLAFNNLAPEAAFRSVVGFNIATRGPGQYRADLMVRRGPGNVCQSQVNFVVAAGPGLVGAITSTPTIVNRGQTVALSYEVSNVGNVDITPLNLTLLVVRTNDGSVPQTFNEQTALVRGQQFRNNRSLSTSALTAGEYLVVLRGEIGGTNHTLASAPLRLNSSSFEFSSASYSIAEDAAIVQVTVERTGDLSTPATVDYQTSDQTASERTDHTTALGRLRFGAGEVSKSFAVLVNDDSFVEASEPLELALVNPIGAGLGQQAAATLTLSDSGRTGMNPLDNDAAFFVRQHYHDFLNREPDTAGFQFWMNEITSCGTDVQCIQVKRINVSAAFYLSIEFQQTGYLVHRAYRAVYDRLPRYREFLRDTQELGRGVVVGQGNWEAQLEANKEAFVNELVQRESFLSQYPLTLTPLQFVDALNANTGNALSSAERDQLVAGLQNGTRTRAQVVRAIIENTVFSRSESNRGFVYMQYVGYLRRNPDDAPDNNLDGLNFWLAKLNQFGGNFADAEMVKAFLISTEFRARFGQP